MIASVMADSFAEWLISAMAEVRHSDTGLPVSKAEFADMLNVSPGKLQSWLDERQRKPTDPSDVRVLAYALNRSEWEILEAMGFKVRPDLTPDERQLLASFQRLSPGLRRTALRVVRSLPEPQQYRPRRSRISGDHPNHEA